MEMTTKDFADAIAKSGLQRGRYQMAGELADWLEKESDGMRLSTISTDRLLDFLKGLLQ